MKLRTISRLLQDRLIGGVEGAAECYLAFAEFSLEYLANGFNGNATGVLPTGVCDLHASVQHDYYEALEFACDGDYTRVGFAVEKVLIAESEVSTLLEKHWHSVLKLGEYLQSSEPAEFSEDMVLGALN